MRIRTRIDKRGRTSVPAKVRKKLEVGPGSILKFEERDGEIFVSRAGHGKDKGAQANLVGGVRKVDDGARVRAKKSPSQ